MTNNVEGYYILFGLLCTGTLLSLVLLSLSFLAGKYDPNSEKSSAYECGFRAFENTRDRFDVRFYLVGILFIIFDLEIVFLFPWCLGLGYLTIAGFFSMLFFLSLLGVGFFYEIKKGRLDWELLFCW